jgi:hypothetical protein
VFSGDPEYPGDVEKLNRGDYEDDAAFIATYSMTLDAAKHRPGESVAPEDVSGYISWYSVKVTFNGVRGARGEREELSSDGAVMESYWEVLLNEFDEDDDSDSVDWLDMEGNAVGAAVVLDDNGSPFLVFDWHHPEAPRCSWSGYYLGKRLVEGKDWRLTDEERGRLGIGAMFRDVEQLFKEGTPGVYSEDVEEEERLKAAEKKRKANTGETGAKKRKANTGETGAKKRKVSANETGTNKTNASTSDETAANKTNASADETGAKKRRKRRRRRAKPAQA